MLTKQTCQLAKGDVVEAPEDPSSTKFGLETRPRPIAGAWHHEVHVKPGEPEMTVGRWEVWFDDDLRPAGLVTSETRTWELAD